LHVLDSQGLETSSQRGFSKSETAEEVSHEELLREALVERDEALADLLGTSIGFLAGLVLIGLTYKAGFFVVGALNSLMQ
jgi:hypothetical protein